MHPSFGRSQPDLDAGRPQLLEGALAVAGLDLDRATSPKIDGDICTVTLDVTATDAANLATSVQGLSLVIDP